MTGADLLDMNIEKIPALVDPIIPKGCLAALAGTSDVGKSTLLLQLCSDIALGDQFLGFSISAEHRRTLYISTEDDKFTISNRLQRLRGQDNEGLKRMRFLFNTEDLVEKVESLLKEMNADLVVVDTFADVYPGEMNQVNKVRYFLNDFFSIASKYGCTIVFNHHTGKYTEERPPNKNNLIGSQGFEGKCRVVMELRPDPGNPVNKHLCIVKGNYLGPEYKEASFELKYDNNLGFQRTGNRISFNQLSRPKMSQGGARTSDIISKVLELRKENKSYSEITDLLKQEGYNIGKSTVGDWVRSSTDRPNT